MEKFSKFRFLVIATCAIMYIRAVSVVAASFPSTNCSITSNCSSIQNAVCDINGTNKCICRGAFIVNRTACRSKVLNDACVNTTDCRRVINTICGASNTCVCSDSFKEVGKACTNKVLNDTCKQEAECTHVSHATCDGNTKKCNCTGDYKVNGTVCAQKVVGGSCSTKSDCPLNANCSKTCMCISGHIKENGLCPVAVGTACNKTNKCVLNAECDKPSSKCQCTSGHVASNGQCSQQSSAVSVRWTINMIFVSSLLVVFWTVI